MTSRVRIYIVAWALIVVSTGFARSQAPSDYKRLAEADVVVRGRVASADLTAERALTGTPFATPLIRIDLDPTEVIKGEVGTGLLSVSIEREYVEQMRPILESRFALVFLRQTKDGLVPILGKRGEIVGLEEDAEEFVLIDSLVELQASRTQSERTTVLEQMLADDTRSQLAALDAISEIGYDELAREPLREMLLSALSSPNVDVRRDVAIQLGEVGDDAALPYLIESLKDQSLAVRSAAASSLGFISGRNYYGIDSESDPAEVYLNWKEWYREVHGHYPEPVLEETRELRAQAGTKPHDVALPDLEALASETVEDSKLPSASDSAAPPAAALAEAADGTPWGLWALPVLLGMLAIYITVIRRRKKG